MAVRSKFGVNYKSLQANWTADLAFFQNIGMTNIRPNVVSLGIPWAVGNPAVVGSTAYWRACAKMFADAGFYVTWGPSSPANNAVGNLTAARWAQYHDAVVSEATYLQAQGIALGDFELGNELNFYVDGTTLTVAQLFTNIRQLATDVKAVYTLSPVSYASTADGVSLADFQVNGLGGLDLLSFHPYGAVTSPTSVSFTSFNSFINAAVTSFGNKTYFSEFGLDGTLSNYNRLYESTMASATNTMITSLESSGVTKYMLYTFVGQDNADDNFVHVFRNNSTNPAWFDYFTSKPTQYSNGARTSVTRTSVPVRTSVTRTSVVRPLYNN